MDKIIEGWFNYDDIYDLAIKQADSRSKFLEIGCFLGKSTEYLCRKIKESGKNIEVYIIDIFDTDYPLYVEMLQGQSMYDLFQKNISEHLSMVKIFKGDSKVLHTNFKDNFFDMIFIDGDHDYEGIKSDLNYYYSKLKKRGLFGGHDYTEDCGVPIAVNEFVRERNLPLTISRSSWLINKYML